MEQRGQYDASQGVTRDEVIRAFTELRNARDDFHRARLITQQAIAGMDPRVTIPRDVLAERVRVSRDQEMEQKAAEGLRDLLRLINGHDPTRAEMEAGPPAPEALGFLPMLAIPTMAWVAVTAVGGAWGLSSIFRYLASRERTIQEQNRLGTGGSTWTQWLLPAGLAAGVAGLGWLFVKSRKGGKAGQPVAQPASVKEDKGVRNKKAEEEPEGAEDEEDEDEDLGTEPEDDEGDEE